MFKYLTSTAVTDCNDSDLLSSFILMRAVKPMCQPVCTSFCDLKYPSDSENLFGQTLWACQT